MPMTEKDKEIREWLNKYFEVEWLSINSAARERYRQAAKHAPRLRREVPQ